jgi:hypothetical protein
VIKPQPVIPRHAEPGHLAGNWWTYYWKSGGLWNDAGHVMKCPYGQIGDRLWVRETYSIVGDGEKIGTCYRVDGEDQIDRSHGERWLSPRFMPHWASRITLDIVNIRVERVQEIGEADAFAEGIIRNGYQVYFAPGISPSRVDYFQKTATRAFSVLWNSINAKRGFGWDDNPWVWVVEFAPLTPLRRESTGASPRMQDQHSGGQDEEAQDAQ